MNIIAWTDYPFIELGDEPGKEAPVRRIELISYDGDKYVRVRLPDGQESEIKAGYCYKQEGRLMGVPSFSHRELLREIGPLDDRRDDLRSDCGLDAFAQPSDVWLSMAVAAESRGHKQQQIDYERAAEISAERWGGKG